jgi:hypothetical protein
MQQSVSVTFFVRQNHVLDAFIFHISHTISREIHYERNLNLYFYPKFYRFHIEGIFISITA